jgi:hypothetical protein
MGGYPICIILTGGGGVGGELQLQTSCGFLLSAFPVPRSFPVPGCITPASGCRRAYCDATGIADVESACFSTGTSCASLIDGFFSAENRVRRLIPDTRAGSYFFLRRGRFTPTVPIPVLRLSWYVDSKLGEQQSSITAWKKLGPGSDDILDCSAFCSLLTAALLPAWVFRGLCGVVLRGFSVGRRVFGRGWRRGPEPERT